MTAKIGDTFRAAEALIGANVVSASGRSLGRVTDLELDPTNGFRVVAVELGRFGWIDRLNLLRPIAHGLLTRPIRLVPWSEIERLEEGRLVCQPGTKVTQLQPAAEEEPRHPDRTAAGG
jgi:sporulation protein YlmC with PRC-barrel domain